MIKGVLIKELPVNEDGRGSLVELFRLDDDFFRPAMGYLSITEVGVMRGPHQHREQTDRFVFINGSFELYLWERVGTERETYWLGEDKPSMVIVPPGVIHAYKNVGIRDAYVLNFPDKLYAGWDKKEEVDEIRHEEDVWWREGMSGGNNNP